MINKLTFHLMNYPLDRDLDLNIQTLLSKDISKVEEDRYERYVYFKDGSFLTYWIENKWYGYASQGAYMDKNKNKYTWINVRPKRSTLLKMDKTFKQKELWD